jgi:hypothetical protein
MVVDPAKMTTAFAELKITVTDSRGKPLLIPNLVEGSDAGVSATPGEIKIRAHFLPELMVDGNRDGKMSFDDPDIHDADTTSEWMPYRFWVNEDHPLWMSGSVQLLKPNDCQELARLWVSLRGIDAAFTDNRIKVFLRWRNCGDTTPAIRLYQAVDFSGAMVPTGGYQHVQNTDAAKAQISKQFGRSLTDWFNGGRTVVVKNQTFQLTPLMLGAPVSPGTGSLFLLFEGVSEGKGELYLDYYDNFGHKIAESAGIWLELKDVKKMYERFRGDPPDGVPSPYLEQDHKDPSTTYTRFDAIPFERPSDETDEAVVFVHGIQAPGTQSTADGNFTQKCATIFKRLWWQGYKGRFAAFKWAALTPAPDLSVSGILLPPHPLSRDFRFNESEYRAWKYGQGLADFVKKMPQTHKHLFAHSQGNDVVGTALTVSGLQVENYAMTQAANPAGCYDPSNETNSYEPFVKRQTESPTPVKASELGYIGYLQTLNITGKVWNFNNPYDFALVTGKIKLLGTTIFANWEANQTDYKPNTTYGYLYDQEAKSPFVLVNNGRRDITDIHESMSFVSRPLSQAAGALDATRGAVFKGVNLSDTLYGFGTSSDDHGAQWVRPIQETWSYYHALGEKLAIIPTD